MQTINIIKKNNYAILQLQQGKVNAINYQFVKEVRSAMQILQEEEAIRGVIIVGQPRYFSAGLDVIELYGLDKKGIEPFFRDFGKMYMELARFPKPLIAAITGHAPAGGTVIAMTCDYRVMTEEEKYTLGLNEVLVNVPLSEDLIRGYAFWLGDGLSARYLLQGKLMTAKEAQAVGFVDEVCPMNEVLERAEAQMKRYLRSNDRIFRDIKYRARKHWINQIGQKGEQAMEETMEVWWQPEVRTRMKMFVEMLQGKKSKT